jgi:SET domain-containing protein
VADGKRHIVLISKTAIHKGEELCYDYKLPLDGTEQPCLYNILHFNSWPSLL